MSYLHMVRQEDATGETTSHAAGQVDDRDPHPASQSLHGPQDEEVEE